MSTVHASRRARHVGLAALATATVTAAALAVAGPAAAASAPTVTKLNPTSGKTAGGTRIEVAGKGLSHVKAVHFGSVAGTSIKVVSSTKLDVTAPAHAAGVVDVRVVTSAGTSAAHTADHFTYVAPPTVTKVSPATGPTKGATRVTVTGTNFTHVSTVDFGAAAGTSLKVVKSTEIQVTAPKHTSGLVGIRVTTSYGTSAAVTADHYVYLGTWTPTTPTQPSGALLGQLNGVSCVSTSVCVAVGDAFGVASSSYLPVIETLSAGTWTGTSPPLPPGTVGGNGVALQSVSCVSATSCVAVGHDRSGSNNYTLPLIETLAHGVWTASTPALPNGTDAADADTGLYAVSCSSATSCIAVGNDTAVIHGGELPLAETLTGGSWQPSTLPQPAGTTHGLLRGLSCASKTTCTAVGYDAGGGPIAVSLAAGTWTASKPALPSGDTTGELLSVSCTSAATCTATGTVLPSAGRFDPLVETLAHGTWAHTTPHLPSGDTLAQLDAVSCTSATACMATGYDDINSTLNPYGNQSPLVEMLSGGAWTPATIALPTAQDGIASLEGVTCPSATACHAVGTYYDAANDQSFPLDERFDGSA